MLAKNENAVNLFMRINLFLFLLVSAFSFTAEQFAADEIRKFLQQQDLNNPNACNKFANNMQQLWAKANMFARANEVCLHNRFIAAVYYSDNYINGNKFAIVKDFNKTYRKSTYSPHENKIFIPVRFFKTTIDDFIVENLSLLWYAYNTYINWLQTKTRAADLLAYPFITDADSMWFESTLKSDINNNKLKCSNYLTALKAGENITDKQMVLINEIENLNQLIMQHSVIFRMDIITYNLPLNVVASYMLSKHEQIIFMQDDIAGAMVVKVRGLDSRANTIKVAITAFSKFCLLQEKLLKMTTNAADSAHGLNQTYVLFEAEVMRRIGFYAYTLFYSQTASFHHDLRAMPSEWFVNSSFISDVIFSIPDSFSSNLGFAI